MQDQQDAWNRGDLEGFMQGYWQSDSLLFIGKSGPTNGWQKTFNNYKKNYPDTIIMGKLSFDVLEIKKLSDQYCFVIIFISGYFIHFVYCRTSFSLFV